MHEGARACERLVVVGINGDMSVCCVMQILNGRLRFYCPETKNRGRSSSQHPHVVLA